MDGWPLPDPSPDSDMESDVEFGTWLTGLQLEQVLLDLEGRLSKRERDRLVYIRDSVLHSRNRKDDLTDQGEGGV